MQFLILGPIEVRQEGRAVPLGGVKQRALLAVLLLRANEVVSRDVLIDELWGEAAGERARRGLNVRLSRLRNALDEGGESPLETRPSGYVLRVAPGALDLHRFTRLAEEGREALRDGDPRHAAAALRGALELWRGPALSDLRFEPFAQLEIDRLEEFRLAVVEDRVDADLALGRHAEAISELEALVARHPLREQLRAQLMIALYRCGRQADALKVYRETRRELVEELGIEPGRRLRELESSILRQDLVLDSPSRPSTLPGVVVAPARETRPERPGDLRAQPPRARRARHRMVIAAVAVATTATTIAVVLAERSTSRVQIAAANSIVIVDPAHNRGEAAIPVGARPSALASGSGSVWVANQVDRTITRIDPRTRKPLRTIPVAVDVAGLTSGAGVVWYATPRGGLLRLDPAFNSVTAVARLGEHALRFARPPRPLAVNAGSVWMADADGALARIDPNTGKVAARIDIGANVSAMAAGAGSVWAVSPLDDTVSRVDATNAVSTIPVGHGPSGVAVGAGSVWVADRYDDAVQRIDPDTDSVVTTISVGTSPEGIAFAAGSVWVANSHDDTLSRIDPATNKVVATIPVGGSPTAVVPVDGRPWVTVIKSALPLDAALPADSARVSLETGFSSLDPALAFDDAAWQVEHATNALVASYPALSTGPARAPQLDLARSVSHSADQMTWTFRIRQDVRFSPPSNATLTALTVKRSVERALDPRMNGGGSFILTDLVGEPAFLGGKAQHISGLIAFGDRLTVRLTKPTPDLLARLAIPYFSIVPENTPIDPNGVSPVPSAGPYYVTSYVPDQELVLRRNPNYRGTRRGDLDEIVYEIGIGRGKTRALVARGDVDYAASGIPGASQGARLAGRRNLLLYPKASVRYLALNTHRRLFASPQLRRAVSYAIDRTRLARILTETPSPRGGLVAKPADSYLPPGVPGAPTGHIYPLHADLRAARKLAGRIDRTAVLYTCNTAPCPQIAAELSSELSRIGIALRVRTFPGGTAFQEATKPNASYDILAFGWEADWLDPSTMLEPLLDPATVGKPNNFNFANFRDPATSARLAAASDLAPPKRYQAFAHLAADLERQASPLIAYGIDQSYNLFSGRIACQRYEPLYGVDLATLCVTR